MYDIGAGVRVVLYGHCMKHTLPGRYTATGAIADVGLEIPKTHEVRVNNIVVENPQDASVGVGDLVTVVPRTKVFKASEEEEPQGVVYPRPSSSSLDLPPLQD